VRILIAPDKFKGSLTAAEVAANLASGLSADHVVTQLPLADGGDGSIDAAVAGGFARHADVAFDGQTLVVEIANTCGIALLRGELDPLGSSTHLLGQALVDALPLGPRRIVIAAGGSASTDGGMGLLAALGLRFLDGAGAELPPSGGSLERIARIDTSALIDLTSIELVCATDVDNPLTGPHGAAAVFGPQKGATPEDVATLERGLANLGRRMSQAGFAHAAAAASVPGAGAAGGTAFAVLALGGSVVSGADFFLDLLGFDALAAASDLVITGEGSLDEQTAAGKLVAVVARRAAPVPVVAVVGRSLLSAGRAKELGLVGVVALSDHADTTTDPELSARILREIARDAVATHDCGWQMR
jgi:glycerate 2-kinase